MTQKLNPCKTSNFGDEEGAICGRNGCSGVIREHPAEGCSCHINPPCGSCTTPREWCQDCDWSAEEEIKSFYHNGYRCTTVSSEAAGQGIYGNADIVKLEPRPLDPTKIDYHVRSHTNSSQICEGVYPSGTAMADVLDKVRGTFGGRFDQFGNGKFRYVAYTD